MNYQKGNDCFIDFSRLDCYIPKKSSPVPFWNIIRVEKLCTWKYQVDFGGRGINLIVFILCMLKIFNLVEISWTLVFSPWIFIYSLGIIFIGILSLNETD